MNLTKSKIASKSGVLLNPEHLLSMARGDEQILKVLIEKGKVALEESTQRIQQYLHHDPVLLRRELHKLKGSLGIIEPTHLYLLCRDLEAQFLTLNEDERYTRSQSLIHGVTLLVEELKGLSISSVK